MEDYNYLSTYGDFGSPTSLITKKTVEDITANAPKELDTFKEVADKISELESAGGGSSADVDALTQTVEQNKAEADAKFEEIDNALNEKADASELASLADGIEYDSDAKKIYLKHGDDVLGEIDATQFIKDGMISNVEIDGTDLVITFNEDAGDKETIRLSLASIFDASNYVTRHDFDEYVTANDEAIASINETLGNKLDSNALDGYVEDANYVHTDNNYTTEEKTKLEGLNNYDDTALVGRVEALEGASYVEDANYVHTDNNYTTEEKDKLADLSNYDDTALTERVETIENANYVEDANYVHTDNNYTTEEKNKLESLNNYDDTELAGRVTALEEANYVEDANYVHTDNNYTTEEKTKLEGLNNYDDSALVGRVEAIENANYVEDANYVHTDNNYTTEEKTKLEGLNNYDDTELAGRVEALEGADFLTTTTGDYRYYTKEETNNIFVAKSQYEDGMSLKADKSELGDYATDSELASALHGLVVRLTKLEAQNAILVEKGTDSADDITGMTDVDALNADIVVATDEAIEALSTPKTFNSITIAGGEVGDNTVINLLAKDSIEVNGLTVSGTKGNGNGKIVYGSKDITISNVNIEPGCTVYNVFEGKQDKAEDNLVENFTATNVIVDDIDLMHNVFNIYQLADGANILVKDSVFNLNVAKSNVMRVSNITNAKNVTITFENVEWSYEEKGYTPSDYEWAGLLIYQPYSTDDGYDTGVAMEYKAVHTWTINVKNCRYNGEPIEDNLVGTIKQAVYQYDVNKSGASEAPTAFGSVVIE